MLLMRNGFYLKYQSQNTKLNEILFRALPTNGVAFLVSERSSYATGASFVVDGGLTLIAAELSS
jgi:hypothetical protein